MPQSTPKHLAPHSPLQSEVVVALAPALDALGGNQDGHVLRSVIIGMQIGNMLDLGQLAGSDLFYALLLKDIGSAGARAQSFHSYGELTEDMARLLRHADLTDLSNTVPLSAALLRSKAPLGRKLRNVSDLILGNRRQPTAVVRAGSRVAASLALEMGFSHGTAAALRSKTERWDGRGRPDGLSGEAIPTASRVIAVAEELELLLATEPALVALEHLEAEGGRRFDPVIVKLAQRLVSDGDLLDKLVDDDLESIALNLEPMQRRHVALASRVDRLLTGIGRLIDSRSSWRTRHTERVRQLATGAASALPAPYKLGVSARRRLARAALLHDVGKISTPIAIHDHPRALTDEQLKQLAGNRDLVDRVVERVLDLADAALVTETFVIAEGPGPNDMAGTATDQNLQAELIAALINLADRFEALLSPRPQRAGKSVEQALEILRSDVAERQQVSGVFTPGVITEDYVDPWEVALRSLEQFVASPSAASLLVPRKFDADAIVVVD